jgi:pyruvate/2-oxoglutarate dehydrogenase complex dihydrolipoamide dehydrogenase (E3) component
MAYDLVVIGGGPAGEKAAAFRKEAWERAGETWSRIL